MIIEKPDHIFGEDVYNCNILIAKDIIKRLKKFNKYYTYPPDNFLDHSIEDRKSKRIDLEKAKDKWERTINKMILAFEFVAEDNLFFADKEKRKRYKEGIKLFAKYFLYLCD